MASGPPPPAPGRVSAKPDPSGGWDQRYAGSPSLFGEDAMVRILGVNNVNDALFGGMIGFCDQIDQAFMIDAKSIARVAQENVTSLFCCTNGRF